MNGNHERGANVRIRLAAYLPFLICALCAAFFDAAVIISLSLSGCPYVYMICPCVLFMLNAAYLAAVSFALKKGFKCSVAAFLIYSVFTVAAGCAGTLLLFGGEGTFITCGALVLWLAAHMLNVICAATAAFYSVDRLKNRWFTAVITALFAAFCTFYAGFVLFFGLFGQGNDVRTLVYRYDGDNNGYVVQSVLGGTGDTVKIPATFNGKPVTQINCGIFNDGGVKNYYFDCAAIPCEGQSLENFALGDKKFYATKSVVNAVRASFFDIAAQTEPNGGALEIANAITPYGLNENEVFISFYYDGEAFQSSCGKILPIYMGEKGEKFDLSAFGASCGYVTHRNAHSIVDLDWAYENCGKNILNDVKGPNGTILGDFVLKENTVARVEFEKVYKLYFGCGNDQKYDLTEQRPDFCYDILGGKRLNWRYVSESNAGGLLEYYKGRYGFELVWHAEPYGGGESFLLENVEESLKRYGDLRIFPEWTMKSPKIELSDKVSVTYGENVLFSPEISMPALGLTARYEWSHNGEILGNGPTLSLSRPSLSAGQDGIYTLKVNCFGGEVSSLSSCATVSAELTINRKEVGFNWILPKGDDLVYDGRPKRVQAELASSPVGDDKIKFVLGAPDGEMQEEFVNAGDYVICAILRGQSAKNYKVGASGRCDFTILKRGVEVVWENCKLVYNAQNQSPTARAYGVFGQEIILSVSGGAVNAGNFVATATTADGNYFLENASADFIISKAELTVRSEYCTAEYGEAPAGCGFICRGFLGADSVEVLRGTAEYAFTNQNRAIGKYLGCVQVSGLTADNYNIVYEFGDLTITPRKVLLSWTGGDGLIYDGRPKQVRAEVANLVFGDEVEVTVIGGGEINAGEYTATATALNGVGAENYELPQERSLVYEIGRAPVKIIVQPAFSVYGDAEAELCANVEGIIYNEEIEYAISRTLGKNAGKYEISATVIKDNANYEVTVVPAEYEILKRRVSLNWSGFENLVYDCIEHLVSAQAANVLQGDDVSLLFTGEKALNAGEYVARAYLSGSDAANYYLSEDGTLKYSVARAELPLTVEVSDIIYGNLPQPEINGNTGGGALTFTYFQTTNQGEKPTDIFTVGEYYVLAQVTRTLNYNEKTVRSEFSVLPLELSLKWSGYENLVYDGTPKSISAEIAGVLNGDEVWVKVEGGDGLSANNYTATAYLEGSAANNYTLPKMCTCAYAVAKAPLTITAEDKTSVYGQPLEELTATVGGIIYRNEVVFSLEKEEGLDAGVYEIRIIIGDYANYEITLKSGVYTITKATPQIAGFAQGKYEIAEIVAFGSTLGELSSKLPKPSVSGEYVWEKGDGAAVGAVGKKLFKVTFMPNDDKNYNAVNAEITVSVKRAANFKVGLGTENPFEISEDGKTYTVSSNGKPVTLFYEVSGDWGTGAKGDFKVVSSPANGVIFKDGEITLNAAGTYEITFSCAGDDEYMSGEFTVTVIVLP